MGGGDRFQCTTGFGIGVAQRIWASFINLVFVFVDFYWSDEMRRPIEIIFLNLNIANHFENIIRIKDINFLAKLSLGLRIKFKCNGILRRPFRVGIGT